MTERTTGATEAQIEAITKRIYASMPPSYWHNDGFTKPIWEDENQPTRDAWIAETTATCASLIPPDHRLIGPAVIAAIKAAASYADDFNALDDDVTGREVMRLHLETIREALH